MLTFVMFTFVAMLVTASPGVAETDLCYQEFKLEDSVFKLVSNPCTAGETRRRMIFLFSDGIPVGVINNTPLTDEKIIGAMGSLSDVFHKMEDVERVIIHLYPLPRQFPHMPVWVARVTQFDPTHSSVMFSWPTTKTLLVRVGISIHQFETAWVDAVREGVKRRPALCEPCEEEPCGAVKPCEAEVEFLVPLPRAA